MVVTCSIPAFAKNNKFKWTATLPRFSRETKIAHAGVKDSNGTDYASVWLTQVDQGDGINFNIRIYQSGSNQWGQTVTPGFTLLTGDTSTRKLDRHITYNTVLELTGKNIDSKLVRVHAEGYCNFG